MHTRGQLIWCTVVDDRAPSLENINTINDLVSLLLTDVHTARISVIELGRTNNRNIEIESVHEVSHLVLK